MREKEFKAVFDGEKYVLPQDMKYRVKNRISEKTMSKTAKPFVKRSVSAMVSIVLASILVITAAAVGGAQLFSLIYGSEVANYEKYISDASEPVSTENVSFTLEGVLYDGYKGIAVVSLKALNENGKELIEQFNNDIAIRIKGSYTTSGYMGSMFKYEKLNENSRKICGDHMIITTKGQQNITDKINLSSSQFVIASLSGALGEDKKYYKIDWFSSGNELLELKIGWTDNEETVLTDFDISLITNTIEIDCSKIKAAMPEYYNPVKIVISPIAIHVCTWNSKKYDEYLRRNGYAHEDLLFDDQYLIKFTDGSVYDLKDFCEGGDYQTFAESDIRKGGTSDYGISWADENGWNYTRTFSYAFGGLVDTDTIESIIFFGVEYKLR